VAPQHHPRHADEERQVDGKQQPQSPTGMRRIFRRGRRDRSAGAKTGFGNEGGERGGIGLAGIVSNLRFLAGEIDAGGSDNGFLFRTFSRRLAQAWQVMPSMW